MTSASPPYPWFSGITYNPSFFASSSTGDLTKAQANALYLRKTVPDIATALETFNGGVVASSYNITSAAGAIINSYFDSQTNNTSLFLNTPNVSVGSNAGLVRYGGVAAQNGTLTATLGTLTLNPFATLTIAKPLTPSYTTAPTDAQIGYIYTLPLPTFPVAFGASPASRTFTIALGTNTTGVWGIYGTASINCTTNGTITSYKLYINSSGTTVANQQYLDKVMTTGNPVLTTNVSAVAYGASNSITLSQEIVYTGAFQSSANNFNFSIVRIA